MRWPPRPRPPAKHLAEDTQFFSGRAVEKGLRASADPPHGGVHHQHVARSEAERAELVEDRRGHRDSSRRTVADRRSPQVPSSAGSGHPVGLAAPRCCSWGWAFGTSLRKFIGRPNDRRKSYRSASYSLDVQTVAKTRCVRVARARCPLFSRWSAVLGRPCGPRRAEGGEGGY